MLKPIYDDGRDFLKAGAVGSRICFSVVEICSFWSNEFIGSTTGKLTFRFEDILRDDERVNCC